MTLQSMERFGESKYDAKRSHTMQNGIYSYSTAKAYNRDCQRFAEYVKEHGSAGRYTPLRETRELAREYLSREIASGKSAYTLKAERSALAKLFGVKGNELAHIQDRCRADITRSRERYVISEKTGKEILNPSSRAGHFSEKNHKELVEFARSTGLRRTELEHLRGDQFYKDANGHYHIRICDNQGKGGRDRDIHVLKDNEVVREMCERAGHDKVFGKVPQMDVHHYRSEYATERYRELARELKDIPMKERYYCKGDRKGEVFDKKAMEQVSQDLGHTRINVIAAHYLR